MSIWKLSAGTAAAVGKKQLKTDVLPTTAYIMLGEKCRHNCRFCAQAQDSAAPADRLSRVTWSEYAADEAATAIAASFQAGRLKRACLQVVGNGESRQTSRDALAALTAASAVPVCVCTQVESVAAARDLLEQGADRLALALDAATPAVYRQAKGGDWDKRWQLLTSCADELPGRISTHLIVGLGESEEEMITTIAACLAKGIAVGLFAFTPVRGTAWEGRLPPALDQYRRVQIAHYFLRQDYPLSSFRFQDGRLSGMGLPAAEIAAVLADGKAFETSGCSGCNRPYYNERPGSLPYNYPRPLTPAETAEAIRTGGKLW